MGDAYAYRFHLKSGKSFPYLSDGDKVILDTVIAKLGKLSKDEIVAFMHKEKAYINTPPRKVILFDREVFGELQL